MPSPTPLTKLYACLDYCEQQNGRSDCKNCGLTREMIDALTTQHTKEKEELVREMFVGLSHPYETTATDVIEKIKEIAKKHNITI